MQRFLITLLILPALALAQGQFRRQILVEDFLHIGEGGLELSAVGEGSQAKVDHVRPEDLLLRRCKIRT